MKVLKIVYNNETKFILDVIKNIEIKNYHECYNLDVFKDKKKAIPLMTRFGTKNVPLVVLLDENLNEIDAIWSERNPDWKVEITKKLLNE